MKADPSWRNVKEGFEFCEYCQKELKPGAEIWLELSNTNNHYYRDGLPQGLSSQGMFPFGPGCAKRVLKETKDAEGGNI